jgi:hypothetical protein
MSQKVVVKKNAPGWPAMVSTNFSANQKAIRDKIKAIKQSEEKYVKVDDSVGKVIQALGASGTSAGMVGSETSKVTGMWLRNRSCGDAPKTTSKPSPFAPKLVRQCGQCQMLYTTFHACQEGDMRGSFCALPHQQKESCSFSNG